ncbi:cupin domain-containing protein [Actinomycetospora sp. NBRC 106378]|uniref:cupin domain-containing protein n=1 Tax=Actinomycetospora sp. NBRC 106378 TaxID=3032208 RepID=UPI0024A3FDF1|nr:cupin domain-containing protein [Actinomycetospora sp. NBRC 106378]GLZ51887.1 cupin [Actinomycetospora sp. NBRC 106378]
MSVVPRLVVVGHDAAGNSTVERDEHPEPLTVRAFPGQEFRLLWGSRDGGAVVGPAAPGPSTLPFFAGTGGSRLMLVTFPASDATTTPPTDPESAAEVAARLPGLAEVFDPDDPTGMHTTDTLDYGVCLAGTLTLVLDDGREVDLHPGTCVVQQGTRHAWRNDGPGPALMCFVGIGATRAG